MNAQPHPKVFLLPCLSSPQGTESRVKDELLKGTDLHENIGRQHETLGVDWRSPFGAAMSSLRTDELTSLRQTFQLQIFIETGAHFGDGIASALEAGFRAALSCDIWPEMAKISRERFCGAPVQVFEMESLSFLQKILPGLASPTLFWLDAHFPAHYGQGQLEDDITRFPLMGELQIISELKSGVHRDVIVCDDMRVIADPANPRWREGEVADYYVVRGCSLEQLVAPFATTHRVVIDQREEGLLFLLPKKGEGP